jgi:hypothetical protein
MNYWRIFTIFAALLAAGCSEVKLTKPPLALAPQAEALVPPLAVAIIDDEADERGRDYAAQLLKAILDAYPRSTEALPPNAIAAPGRVSMTIHIHQLGAFFNRTRSSVLRVSPELTRIKGSMVGWDSVVAAAATSDPLVSGNVYLYLPGNWSGIANIDIAIEDTRPSHNASFTIPIVAERSRPNDLGYVGATIVAASAWHEVQPRLAACIDAVVRKLREEQ